MIYDTMRIHARRRSCRCEPLQAPRSRPLHRRWDIGSAAGSELLQALYQFRPVVHWLLYICVQIDVLYIYIYIQMFAAYA